MLNALELVFALSIIGVVYSYAIYPTLLVFLSTFFGRPARKSPDSIPRIAVIVPAFNEERVIRRKIENVLALDYPPDRLSLWVGSDQSSDGTDSIVKSFADPRVHLWVAPERGGKTAILNRLVPRVDAEVVLLTDANTLHRPSSLRLLVRSFADGAVGAVAGHVEHQAPGSEIKAEETVYRSFETWQKSMESVLHSSISAFGGFYAVRKELFRPIPDNAYSNDDVLIPMNVIRQQRRVIFDPEAIAEEDLSENATLEFRRRIRIGAGNFQAFFWLLDFLNPLRGWPAFCYVSHKVSRWFSPLFILGAYLSCGVLAFMAPFFVYRALFGLGAAMLVAALSYKLLRLSAFRPMFYFFSMNAALFLGLFRYLGGIKSAAWTRTERSD
ncbi:MAG: glycosyltransferase [Chitinivibrionales bacterium]|nr:glycosyltransferase [Chitinivibrionales bacterium]MBD3394156.1 glycosyltransferase [Chitinivibrionales bacterium]